MDEEIIDPVLYYESRSKIIKNLKENPQRYPYPHKFNVSHTHTAFIKEFEPLCVENGKFFEESTISIGGTDHFQYVYFSIILFLEF